MNLEKTVFALKNDLRRRILKLLSKKPMTAKEISVALGENAPKYRQSINRSLEILREGQLVKKEYNEEKKVLYYSLRYSKIIIELENMEIKHE